MDERVRSTADIRQDIAKEEENLSRTAQQIGERIKEKLAVGEYVKDSPYWALGIVGGIGFLASRALQKRATPMERIMRSLAEELRGSLGGGHVGAAAPSLVKVTLVGIGTKLASGWIRNAISTSGSSCSPPSQSAGDSTGNPDATI